MTLSKNWLPFELFHVTDTNGMEIDKDESA